MQSRDFCFWLQGFFEIGGSHAETGVITREQADTIKRHLALVFQHEIDPAMGGKAHQADLNATHHGPFPPSAPGKIVMRC